MEEQLLGGLDQNLLQRRFGNPQSQVFLQRGYTAARHRNLVSLFWSFLFDFLVVISQFTQINTSTSKAFLEIRDLFKSNFLGGVFKIVLKNWSITPWNKNDRDIKWELQIEQWGFFFWWAMKSMSYVCNFLSLEKSGQSVMSVWSVNTGSSVGMNYWCRLQKLPDFKQEAINLVVCAVFNLLKNLITMPEKKKMQKWTVMPSKHHHFECPQQSSLAFLGNWE